MSIKRDCSILLVDDDDTFRDFVLEGLSARYSRIVEARDGLEAQGILSSRHIDLVVSDVKMPGMTGLELFQRTPFGKSRWILMTGYHESHLVDFCLTRGVSRYIRKPFRLQELMMLVDEVLAEKETGMLDLAPPGPLGWMEVQMESSAVSFRKAVSYFGHYFQDKVPGDDAPDVSRAFEEMLRHVVEWKRSLTPAQVKVGARITPNEVVFRVEDMGLEYENNSGHPADVLYPVLPAEGERDMKVFAKFGRFGSFLSQRIMDSVYANATGSCVIMTRKIAAAPTAKIPVVTRVSA